MSSWAEFYASHGFIAMRIGPNDEINDSHYQRGEGLIDGTTTIIQENSRFGSPVFGLIDESNFTMSGYSMGGGASHNAALIAEENGYDFVRAIISLNPTVLFEDCNYCDLMNVELLGFIAAILTTSAYMPQAYKIWKTRSTDSISLSMYIVMFFGILFWLIYSFLIKRPPLILANTLSLIMISMILYFKLKP